jgi:GTP-binding protein
VPYDGGSEVYRKGVLIASESGVAMGYALNTIQERGDLFISPSENVYEGMIVGINKYDQDMEVNACKARQKSGVRIKHDEITQTALKPPIELTLEFALVFIAKDEIAEITPQNIRLRKVYLTKNQRVWAQRDRLTAYAKSQMGIN